MSLREEEIGLKATPRSPGSPEGATADLFSTVTRPVVNCFGRSA